jgi:hypothetical protein
LEIFVDNQSAIVDKAVVMNSVEDIIIDVLVAGRDEDSAVKFKLILLPALLLNNLFALLVLRLVLTAGGVVAVDIFDALSVLVVLGTGKLGVSIFVVVLIVVIESLDLVFVLLLVGDVKELEKGAL